MNSIIDNQAKEGHKPHTWLNALSMVKRCVQVNTHSADRDATMTITVTMMIMVKILK